MRNTFSLLVLCGLVFASFRSFSITPEVEVPFENKDLEKEKPSISKELFGEINGQQIFQYTLKNSKGMVVKVINYGATITDVITADRNGDLKSVVLGFDSLSGYTGPTNAVLGAAVGRVANRIANKKFTLDGKEYLLTSTIHGGLQGFAKRVWNIQEVPGTKNVGLKLTYFSKDGEEGFPGNLNVTMIYTLTGNNELKIDYEATTDQATPVVLTNHSYFNLSGGRDEKALDTELTIAADQYLESGNGGMPTGKFVDLKGTPYDFTVPRKIGERINENNEQLKRGSGYDIAYALRNKTGRLAFAARAYEPVSGRVMEVYTTEPGVIFYTANHISERLIGRGGKPSTKNSSFCLETQHFPDSPNQPTFPNTILRPGQKFKSQTVFRFSARK